MSPVLTALFYLFSIFFGIICYALIIRIGLTYFRVSTLHQISQLIHTITNPLVNLTKQITDLEKNRPRLAYNTLLTLVIVVIIKYIIGNILFYNSLPFGILAILIIADLIIMPLNLLFICILIRAIMSWIQPDWRHPIQDILILFTEPFLRIARYILPNISGFDFSPLLVIVFIQLLVIFISASLPVRLL